MSLLHPVTGKNVVFDDCRLSDGAMIDAKGPGYAKMLEHGPDRYPWAGVEEGFLEQADRQWKAASNRPLEWHFAEREVADYVRGFFEYKNIPITVVYTPWQR